jgi:large subunit ribosomal protein L10
MRREGCFVWASLIASEVNNEEMNKQQEAKAELVQSIRKSLEKSQAVVLVDYRGLNAEEETDLRKQMRDAGVEYRVLKNTLIKRASDELSIVGLDGYLNGPTAVAFGLNDPTAPAKILGDYIDKTKKMEIKCGLIGTSVIDPKGVSALAQLPSREVLLAKALGSMNAPITGLVTVLGGTLRKLLYALNAVKDAKGAA